MLGNFLISKIVFIVLFTTALWSRHSHPVFEGSDLDILKQFNIDETYIKDVKFQKIYTKLIKKGKKQYKRSLNNSIVFLPKIKKIIKQNNMPDGFLYLAMAESYFDTNATSSVKAKGIWQFMKPTALRYGLTVNDQIDERMDIVKATNAALKYLKYQKKSFKYWYLAILGYNCGEGRVYEALTRAGLDRYVAKTKSTKSTKRYAKTIRKYQKKQVKFGSIYKIYKNIKTHTKEIPLQYLLKEQKDMKRQYFPKESRNYIRKILSLNIMAQKSFLTSSDDTHLLNIGTNDTLKKFELKRDILLENIAILSDMDIENLASLNKHILNKEIVSAKKRYNLYIPYKNINQNLLYWLETTQK
jgi:membrane-bound lytic murein transglycosylase D